MKEFFFTDILLKKSKKERKTIIKQLKQNSNFIVC